MKTYKKYMVGVIAVALAIAVSASFAAKVHAQYVIVTATPQFGLFNCSDFSFSSTGPCVVQLQGVLSELGYLNVPMGVPFGYFGPLTRSALIRYQSDLAVSATGNFDLTTRTQMQASFSTRGWLNVLFPTR